MKLQPFLLIRLIKYDNNRLSVFLLQSIILLSLFHYNLEAEKTIKYPIM